MVLKAFKAFAAKEGKRCCWLKPDLVFRTGTCAFSFSAAAAAKTHFTGTRPGAAG